MCEKNILLGLSLMFALLPLLQIFITGHLLVWIVYVYNLLIDFGLWHSWEKRCAMIAEQSIGNLIVVIFVLSPLSP